MTINVYIKRWKISYPSQQTNSFPTHCISSIKNTSIVSNVIFVGKKELIDYVHNLSLKFEVDGSAIRRKI